MRKHFKNMSLTATGTLGSRILGLLRDQLTAGFFGAGMVGSALLFALQIPNLFRRLLGEGALTAALVPVMSDEHRLGGRESAFRFLNQVLTRATPLIVAIALVTMLTAWSLSHCDMEPRHRLAATLTALCMPYMPLACLAAVFSGALNLLGRFGVTSLGALWLNIAMIGALCTGGILFAHGQSTLAVWVCYGTLLGGALQLLAPAAALWREGWRPRIDFSPSESWERLKTIFLPAVAGAGVQQVNFLVSRFLALNTDDRALTVYYLANRIVELPIGIFAITISTVVFPIMAMHAAAGENDSMGAEFARGTRLLLAITLPAAAGIIALAQPIVCILFEHGKFTADDTAAALPVLCVFAGAMPFHGMAILMGRALNAVKETRIQAKIAGWVFALNLLLSPPLAWAYGATGLAVANLAAAIFQCAALWVSLRGKDPAFTRESPASPLAKSLAASLITGVFAYGAWIIAAPLCAWIATCGIDTIGKAAVLVLLIAISAALYFALLFAFRHPESDFLRKKIARFRQR
ncbi:MAG: murein biosynthesis integral membrane protein MurJ [Puniceicoccales bacterium]|jgi:putative peptidoglycan lipid II flippase|nr:murein biosynthesis integral membrane protein MurJ [Puniceicoccales bacterium]